MAGGVALLLAPALFAITRTPPCSTDEVQDVGVSVVAELLPAVTAAAERVQPTLEPRCLRLRVGERRPDEISRILSGEALTDVERTDVWIPDSSTWLARHGLSGLSLARSPLVISQPAGTAKADRIRTWKELFDHVAEGGKARLPDPFREAAGTELLAAARTMIADPTRRTAFVREMGRRTAETSASLDDTLAVLPERMVWKHNTEAGGRKIRAAYPAFGVPMLDYPLAVLNGDPRRRAAAELLRAELEGEPTRRALLAEGFRTPESHAPSTFTADLGVFPSPPRVLAAPGEREITADLAVWTRVNRGLRMLVLLDVSRSMGSEVRPGRTGLSLLADFARAGLELLPDDTDVGMWTFAGSAGQRPWEQLVPTGPLDEQLGETTRRAQLKQRYDRVKPLPRRGSALYEAFLAGFRDLSGTYRPDRTNVLLILTDGVRGSSGLSLAETVRRLSAEVSPQRPVRAIVVGVGDRVDVTGLRSLVAPLDGMVFTADEPSDARRHLIEAITSALRQEPTG